MKVEDVLKHVTDETNICILTPDKSLDECEIWMAYAWANYRYSKYIVRSIIPRTSLEYGNYLLIKCYSRKGVV